MKSDDRFSRRDFLKLAGYSLLVGSFTLFGGVEYSTKIEPAWLDVNRLSLRLPRLDPAFAGFRLVQISDIHMGGWMNRERLDRVVEAILAESPDLVVITGDYLLGHGWDEAREQALEDVAEALKPLIESSAVLTVMGNHDHWTDVQKIRSRLSQAEVADISNSVYSLRRGDNSFHICGVDDVYEGLDRMEDVLSQLPENGAAILLCHEPDFADTSAATDRFDLQISGHSHGGQVVLPFMGPINTPRHAHKYPLGMYQVGNMMQYTNRGVGMARIAIRFNCRPEITVFTFERS
jgi:predicted MPP superfamily phosphohydrolase